jgi:hypothetical protein
VCECGGALVLVLVPVLVLGPGALLLLMSGCVCLAAGCWLVIPSQPLPTKGTLHLQPTEW